VFFLCFLRSHGILSKVKVKIYNSFPLLFYHQKQSRHWCMIYFYHLDVDIFDELIHVYSNGYENNIVYSWFYWLLWFHFTFFVLVLMDLNLIVQLWKNPFTSSPLGIFPSYSCLFRTRRKKNNVGSSMSWWTMDTV